MIWCPASADLPVTDYSAALEDGVSGLRIGIPRAFVDQAPALTQAVRSELDRVANILRAAGAIVEDVSLPDFSLYAACGRVIMLAEAFAIHEADLRS